MKDKLKTKSFNITALILYAIILVGVGYMFLFRREDMSIWVEAILILAVVGILLNIHDRVQALRDISREKKQAAEKTSDETGESDEGPGEEDGGDDP